MKSTILTLMLALILAPVAQSKSLPNRASLGQEFTLPIGKKVSLRDIKLNIRFVSVIEDSRCPQGVQCVWQGNAKASFQLSGFKRKASTVRLNTAIEPKEAEYSGYKVKLVKITPEPKTGERLSARRYQATLVVLRNQQE